MLKEKKEKENNFNQLIFKITFSIETFIVWEAGGKKFIRNCIESKVSGSSSGSLYRKHFEANISYASS